MLTVENAAEHLDRTVQELPFYPGGHEGRGIVIPGGGIRYFPCAWVCIHMLRRLGCTLPIELWHLGPSEMTAAMRDLVQPLGVTTIDAWEVRKCRPVQNLEGWQLKPFAIINTRFAEVMLLDADNVPVVDPAFLFETSEFERLGAIFWPDFKPHPPDHVIWRLTGVSYRNEPQVESGQLLIDKRRCWKPLQLAMWMNEHSDFWYQYVLGDKETFHFAWRKLHINYAMPAHPIDPLYCVMCQHDFEGRRIFQHRNMAKWSLVENPRIKGFQFEEECLHCLAELREKWDPLVGFAEALPEADREMMCRICRHPYRYVRVGFDQRRIMFREDGLVSGGNGGRETIWWIDGNELILASDPKHVTCRLRRSMDGVWEGKWLVAEEMPVRLEPLAS